LVPVGLGVGDRGDGEVAGLARDGPSRLGDPDLLAAHGGLGGRESVLEEAGAGSNGVGHGVLEVRVSINPDEVRGTGNGRVGAVDPGGPSVDVTDGDAAQPRARNDGTDTADAVDDVGRLRTHGGIGRNAHGGVAVEILTADRDTGDEAGEGGAIFGDGGLEGGDFVLNRTRGPDTKEQMCALGNGGGDGTGGIGGGSGLLGGECQQMLYDDDDDDDDDDDNDDRPGTGRRTIMVYRRALVKPPLVPTSFFAVAKRLWNWAWVRME
jgi:hypothetical protein